jgi:hypothetical protein
MILCKETFDELQERGGDWQLADDKANSFCYLWKFLIMPKNVTKVTGAIYF